MLFNSPTFVLFFCAVFCLYWALARCKAQNILLLIASYIFYGTWSWKFLMLLWASTAVDYTVGRLMASTTGSGRRRALLITSVAVNLTFLGFFKYYNFFLHETVELLGALGFQMHPRVLQIVLPVGISFYTFQSLGYVIDVYRGKLTAERNFLHYALFVAFFPQLVAGPIERAAHMLPQYKAQRRFSGSALESGLQLMVWGLFKKIVIADNLAPYVNVVFGDPSAYSAATLTSAVVFFAFQIYCDFSGYSDTARGAARTLGFELMVNFNLPYFSRSPVEFWRRWHISLSQWFQDYLYFPLAMRYMRKGGWASKYRAHIISMGLIGFWHGANLTFLAFGLYWGVVIAGYLYISEQLQEADPKGPLQRITHLPAFATAKAGLSMLTMFVIVCIGWILFRATSLTQFWTVVTSIVTLRHGASVLRPDVADATMLWCLVAGIWVAEFLYRHSSRLIALALGGEKRRLFWRYAMFCAIVLTYAVAQQGRIQPFIYFQF
jgi:alginate O-acetyltransferase complex protein AlgI